MFKVLIVKDKQFVLPGPALDIDLAPDEKLVLANCEIRYDSAATNEQWLLALQEAREFQERVQLEDPKKGHFIVDNFFAGEGTPPIPLRPR